jgi:hypothetical protein
VERLLEDARHQPGLAHRDRPLGDRLGDRLDVDRLEVSLCILARGACPVMQRMGMLSAIAV